MKSLKNMTVLFSFLLVINAPLSWAQTPLSVSELKQEIVTLAKSYEGQADPDGTKTKNLESLISQLLAQTPALTMRQKAQMAVGAWQQIWGPYSYNDNHQAGPALQADSIYQVIADGGTYTNVGIFDFFGLGIVGILKGEYQIESDKINVKFVKNGILIGDIPEGKTLADLPALHDEHKLFVIDFPSFLPPVGIKGELHETYVDEDLRITYGVQKGQPGQSLYILKRVKTNEN